MESSAPLYATCRVLYSSHSYVMSIITRLSCLLDIFMSALLQNFSAKLVYCQAESAITASTDLVMTRLNDEVILSSNIVPFASFVEVRLLLTGVVHAMLVPNNHHTTTTTILRPFFRDHPGEPVPEENFWTLWCKGTLTEANTQYPCICFLFIMSKYYFLLCKPFIKFDY